MREFRLNIKKDWSYAVITAAACSVILIILEIYVSHAYAVNQKIELWLEASSIMDFFFPLIVTLPFTWKLFFEKKDGYLRYVSIRTSRKKYVVTRILAGMFLAFVMTFVIYYVGLAFAVLLSSPQSIVPENRLYDYVFGAMQAEHPLIFGIFWCMWKGFVGSIICGFGYLVVLYCDNLFVSVLLPFLYCLFENFVTAMLCIPKYSLCTTYILNRLTPECMEPYHYVVGVLTFLVLGSCIIALLKHNQKQVENDEKSY